MHEQNYTNTKFACGIETFYHFGVNTRNKVKSFKLFDPNSRLQLSHSIFFRFRLLNPTPASEPSRIRLCLQNLKHATPESIQPQLPTPTPILHPWLKLSHKQHLLKSEHWRYGFIDKILDVSSYRKCSCF